MKELNLKAYKKIEKKYIKDIDSECYILKHIKTNAKVLLISNDDENKVFSIAFRTPPTDSTGLPHILEHSVLCGSRKFPVKDPFVELMKSSLNTFLNAFTSPDKTMYPVASCNDKDFANLMDVYLDATLYPNIYKYEEIFKQEGWHYELDNKDNDVIINGVVYNEMKGAYSDPNQILFRESMASLYPNTCYGVSSGGKPEDIPSLTYSDFLNFHKRYYHPSNSYIVLYGNMDMEERLEWMDKAYLSDFDAIEIDSSINKEEKFTEINNVRIAYPIGQEEDLNNKTMMSYNISIEDMSDPVLTMSNTILSYVLLDAPGAILKQALIDAGIGKAISGGYQDGLNQPMFSVIAKACEENQKDSFIKIIEDTLKSIVNNGIDKKTLLATVNYYEFMYRESDFGRMPKGLVYAMNALGTWLYDLNPFTSLEVSSCFDKIKELVNTNYFEELIEKYYINNSHKSIVCIYPDKNCQNDKDNKLKEKLREYKNSLDEKGINKLVQDTLNLKKYQMTPSTEEELRSLPTLTRDDIKKEILPFSNLEKEVNGIKVLHHDYFTNGIAYLKLLFDIDKIEEKYLPYINLLTTVLTKLNTEKYSYQELDNEINIKTGGLYFNPVVYSMKDNQYKLVIQANVKSLFDNVNDTCDLLLEIIENSKFDDYQRLKEIIFEQASLLQNRIISGGHVTALTRALSYINEYYKLQDETDGIAYYQFIKNLEKNFDNEKENIANTLKFLAKNLLRKDNLLISITSDKDNYDKVNNSFDKFNMLNDKCEIKFDYVFKENILNEGFKTPSNVQYVARVGNFADKGYKYSGAINVFKKALSTDYLWMKVRVDGGAYGCMTNFGLNGNVYFVSYRDPNLSKTNKVYDGILEFIDSFDKTEEEMTKYIIGAFGDIDAPMSPRDKGYSSLVNYFLGRSEEEIMNQRKEMITCTDKDVKALKDLVKAVLDYNVICVIGNENKIDEEKELFKNISYL